MRCNGVKEDSNNLGNDWMAKVWTINCQLILQICPKNAWEIDPRTNEKPNNNSLLFPDSSNIRWLISGHSGQDRIEGGTWAQGRLQFRESILSGVIANHIGGHIRLNSHRDMTSSFRHSNTCDWETAKAQETVATAPSQFTTDLNDKIVADGGTELSSSYHLFLYLVSIKAIRTMCSYHHWTSTERSSWASRERMAWPSRRWWIRSVFHSTCVERMHTKHSEVLIERIFSQHLDSTSP